MVDAVEGLEDVEEDMVDVAVVTEGAAVAMEDAEEVAMVALQTLWLILYQNL